MTPKTPLKPPKRYTTLLFDVDDTLLDFGAAERAALQALCAREGVAFTPDWAARYAAINRGLWADFEAGRVTREALLAGRFAQAFGVPDGAGHDAYYRGHLETGCQLMPGALELVRDLAEAGARPGGPGLYVVTNGVSRTQFRRLEGAGLLPHFRAVFVSEDAGAPKPARAFFDWVAARVPGWDPAGTLIVGDSLAADVRGGQAAGLDTCWLDPLGAGPGDGEPPTHTVRDLAGVRALLGAHTKAPPAL